MQRQSSGGFTLPRSNSEKDLVEIVPFWKNPLYRFLTIPAVTGNSENEIIETPNTTSIYRHMFAFCEYFPENIIPTEQTEKSIYFWTNLQTIVHDERDKIAALARAYYTNIIPQQIFKMTTKLSSNRLTSFFDLCVKRNSQQRVMFHYIGHPIKEINGEHIIKLSRPTPTDPLETIAFETIFEKSGECSLFIFDADNAASLLSVFQSNPKNDAIAFFSCDKGERVPHGREVPRDIFTTCMLYNPKTAVVCQSLNYYCFSTSPLKPLQSFIDGDIDFTPEQAQVMESIRVEISGLISSMAYSAFPRELYSKMFLRDETVARLTTNFLLARHLLKQFSMSPTSYPVLPDLDMRKEWDSVSLRLDAALFLLKGQSDIISPFGFLSLAISSAEAVFAHGSAPTDDDVMSQLLPALGVALKTELADRSVNVLARYLDSGPKAVSHVLSFPIARNLFWRLERNLSTPALLLCLTKISLAWPKANELLSAPDAVLKPLLKTTPGVVLAAVLAHQTQKLRGFFNKGNLPFGFNLPERSIKNMKSDKNESFDRDYSDDSRETYSFELPPTTEHQNAKQEDNIVEFADPIWTLYFIASTAEISTQTNCAIKIIHEISKLSNQSAFEKAVSVRTLTAFIPSSIKQACEPRRLVRTRSPMTWFDVTLAPKEAMKTALGFRATFSRAVKLELIILISRFLAQYPNRSMDDEPIFNEINQFLEECSNDPFDEVRASAIRTIEMDGSDILPETPLLHQMGTILQEPLGELFGLEPPKLPITAETATRSPRKNRIRPAMPTRKKLSETYQLTANVTSNMAAMEGGYVFGDEEGCIVVNSWSAFTPRQFRLARAPVTYVCTSPFGLAATASDGSVYLTDSELTPREAFFSPLSNGATLSLDYQCEFDWRRSQLFSYFRGAPLVAAVDIVKDARLGDVFAGGVVNDFRKWDGADSVYIIASNTLEVHDLRAPNDSIVAAGCGAGPALFAEQLDGPSVAACHSGRVAVVDFRAPEQVKAFRAPQKPAAFAVHVTTMLAAVGAPGTVALLSLQSGRAVELPPVHLAFATNRALECGALIFDDHANLRLVDQYNKLVRTV